MPSLEPIRAPLVVAHGLAGDLLMSVPALRAIGQRFGFDLPLVCGTEPEHVALLRAAGFTHLHPTLFRTREARPGEAVVIPCHWGFDVEAVLPLAQDRDTIVCMTESPGPAFEALAQRTGLPAVGVHEQADVVVPFDDVDAHTFDRFFALAQAVCGETVRLEDHVGFPHRADAAQIRRQVREATGPGRLLALHADTKPDKMWPLERWAAWLQRLWQDEPQTQVLLLGYPAIPIERYAVDARLLDVRDLPLTVNYEIAGMVDQFVGIDSCMLHAADLCGVPCVGVFNQTYSPRLYGLRFADGVALQGGVPPDDISVEAVWDAYCQLRHRQSHDHSTPAAA